MTHDTWIYNKLCSIYLRTKSFWSLHIRGTITNIIDVSSFNFNYEPNKEFTIDYKNLIYKDVCFGNILLRLYFARVVNW